MTPLVMHVIHRLDVGGMENGLVNLINNMSESSYRHAIVCAEDFSDFRDRIRSDDVPIFALHRSTVGVWRMRRKIWRLCRDLRPAIVHSRNLSGLDAIYPARLAKVRCCVHGEHGMDVDDLFAESRKRALLRRLHSPGVDRYVTVSTHLRRYLAQSVRVDEARITQISNGVDTQRFRPRTSAEKRHLPPDFTDDGLCVVGTVGRLQRIKDQQTLLRSFARLLETWPAGRSRLRLVIVGDGPLRKELLELSKTLGVENLTWFAGSSDAVPLLLRSLDVFVLPSLYEGISNTLLEAMASGVAALTTDVGGNPELMNGGEFGQMFESGDIEGLAVMLRAYAEDRGLRDKHGRAARAIAVERHSLDAMVAAYEALYDELLASR